MGLAFTVAVTVFGAPVQHPSPGVTESQDPPLAVDEVVRKEMAAPVVGMLTVCGRGLWPPKGMVKLIALTCARTFAPSTKVTGTVTLLPGVRKTSSPTKVPASSPPPGKLARFTEMVTFEGAVPPTLEAVNQLPPSEVVTSRVQPKFPDPALRIWINLCGGLLLVATIAAKLICPGTLSKKVPPAGDTVSVTGTVIVRPPP